MELREIGTKVHAKRIETGLLQEHVAKLAGLSRVTINQLENGTLNDLGFSKLINVLDILGVGMSLEPSVGVKSALTVAARSISTSYKEIVTPETLAEMLRSGCAPDRFHPHLMAFLDETPLPVAVKAISEAATSAIPAKKIMKHLAKWSSEWKACRRVWT
ncbi:helix-turn-helix domain-containing protein [Massilia sp. R2A-15]|uniref:helix-turn-helix domain-containing protein n=1 Tax=Massilia sp. R2A-15 TaxID=3064278 RepID=UPI002735D890|nr:helix-turn-helix domain-containing protein [Massilia sp. R2A-15]WLI90745.1 helix-turn-helix domain-containing protein [Massilia sp. R2A-15]